MGARCPCCIWNSGVVYIEDLSILLMYPPLFDEGSNSGNIAGQPSGLPRVPARRECFRYSAGHDQSPWTVDQPLVSMAHT